MLIILNLKANGIINPQHFRFVDTPGPIAFHFATETLTKMGAIDDEGKISVLGRIMLDFPVDPFSSFCLANIIQENETIKNDIITIVSILNAENFFLALGKDKNMREGENRKKFFFPGSDHLTKLNIFYKYCEAKNKREFCQVYGLKKKTLENCLMIREQLCEILKRIKARVEQREEAKISKNDYISSKNIPLIQALQNVKINFVFDREKIIKILQKSFFTRIAELDNHGEYVINHINMRAKIHPESVIFSQKSKPKRVVFNTIINTSKLYISNVSEIA
jgi:HrpA-like RNA helicase